MDSIFLYEDIKLSVPEEVYRPAEDTVLLADNLEVKQGEKVLEIGTGSGLLAILAAVNGADVVATDINKKALECAKENARSEGVEGKIEFRRGDMFEPINRELYDVIIFNPPYLPVPEGESLGSIKGKAWNGGPDGRKEIDRFLERTEDYLKPGGRLYLVQSSLSGISKTVEKFEEIGFQVKKQAKKFSFESIVLFSAFLPSR